MADFGKLKANKRNLPSPPSMDEASQNLAAPETAPADASPAAAKRRDGRSANKTGRTVPFATRVSPAFDEQLRDVAERDGLRLVEVLEKALEAYEKAHTAS
jgi:hypothetical protein